MCALFLTYARYSADDLMDWLFATDAYDIINHNDCMEMIRHDYIHIELNIKIIPMNVFC